MGPMQGPSERFDGGERGDDLESTVQRAVEQYMLRAGGAGEPGAERRLNEERKRREQLERKLNELSEENQRSRRRSEQMERSARMKETLRELGVKKVHLAYRLVKDDILRGDDGELYGEIDGQRVPYEDYLSHFVAENPEFLPPRIAGGSGSSGAERSELTTTGFDIDKIRPGMSRDEMKQAWKEVARLAGHSSNSW